MKIKVMILKEIYIPIWYYLNAPVQETSSQTFFNLHSNMVLLKYGLKELSNDIERNLHSNMVLLKCTQ